MKDLKEICKDELIVLDYSPAENKMSLGKKIALLGLVVGFGAVAGTITYNYLTYLSEYYTARAVYFESLMP